MLTANPISLNGNYEKYYTAAFFDEEAFVKAETLFCDYRSNGIILNDDFSDSEWRFTNQLQNMSISFQFNELNYYKNAITWIGCDYHLFTKSVKTYVVFRLGSLTFNRIREVVKSLRLFVDKTEENLLDTILEYASPMADFLAVLPGEDSRRGMVLESLEERQWDRQAQTGKNCQRVLSEFRTYFKFNDAMQNLWESAGDGEKLFWFPLYLWWTLTAILPLRTTEFLLTPRQCLATENGQSMITLRRTLLKGGGRKFAYRIDKDYETVRYIIPDKMADEIMWYMEATKTMIPASLSTLFVQEPHYTYFMKKPNSTLGYYTYSNLSTCLRCFQSNIMGIATESKIHLGDTRHLAMISLILSGGSPLICKELAGHADINISAHYYSNISSFIECATYNAHLNSRTKAAEMTERALSLPKKQKQTVPVQDGFCDSDVFRRGEIYDCIKSIGANGEIGDCLYCPHFIDGTSGVHFSFANPVAQREQVDQDSLYLLQTLEAVRRGIGLQEDIQSALIRLQQSAYWYGQCLEKKWEVGEYGKAEEANDGAND